jgi:hypothetical protein
MARKHVSGIGHLGGLVGLLFGLVLGSTHAAAAGFCGNVNIREGASRADVLLHCGDPTSIEEGLVSQTVSLLPDGRQVPRVREGSREATRAQRPGTRHAGPSTRLPPAPTPIATPALPVLLTQPVVISEWREEWTYNFGPHSLMLRFHFVDGFVSAIHTLNYGY